MQVCVRCRLVHIGRLLAKPGMLVLFLNDWEAQCTEQDLDFQLKNQLPVNGFTVNTIRFLEIANG